MQLYSTNHKSPDVSLSEAVFRGLPPDNGLYLPKKINKLPKDFFDNIHKLSFQDIAYQVASSLFNKAIPEKDLRVIIDDALNFEVPVVSLSEELNILELFHGPTLAFKDVGARFMARLMSYFLEKENKEVTILVATSGDTGSAVAQGFLGLPNIKIVILYPEGKVSAMQEKQLTTLGQNITALEIAGTFDDCQRMVKEAFLDQELNEKIQLSSANSINIARMLPQSFYYFSAFAQLKDREKPVVFSVPSGNFGNLCGGLVAARMGLPVAKFVAATNKNDVIPQYLLSGEFAAKASVQTISNSMDVGNPSNFYRMLSLYDNKYDKLKNDLTGRSYSDEATRDAIKEVWDKYKYVLDPHTAVAYLGLKDEMALIGGKVNGIALSTAHPSKFPDVVEEATGEPVRIPERLQRLANLEKKSIKMAPAFEDLKSYLLSHSPVTAL